MRAQFLLCLLDYHIWPCQHQVMIGLKVELLGPMRWLRSNQIAFDLFYSVLLFSILFYSNLFSLNSATRMLNFRSSLNPLDDSLHCSDSKIAFQT